MTKAQSTIVYATREKIFGAVDHRIEEVFVPEWGLTVRVRSLTAAERDDFEQSLIDQRGKRNKMDLRNARARLIVRTVVDDKGELMFNEGDVGMLGTKNAAAVDRIFEVAQKLAGLSDDDMDELVNDLKEDPKGVSTSD